MIVLAINGALYMGLLVGLVLAFRLLREARDVCEETRLRAWTVEEKIDDWYRRSEVDR